MFKKIEIENQKEPANPKKIREFEQLTKLELPNEYKKWLLTYNGGKPKIEDTFYFIHPIDKNEKVGGINYFYALYEGEVSNLYKTYITFLNRIPAELIPIADNGCGDQICLGIKGKHLNKVYFWGHENEVMEDNKEPWWDNVYLIANTFADFINKLFYAEINQDEWKKNKRIVYTYHPPSSDFS